MLFSVWFSILNFRKYFIYLRKVKKERKNEKFKKNKEHNPAK